MVRKHYGLIRDQGDTRVRILEFCINCKSESKNTFNRGFLGAQPTADERSLGKPTETLTKFL